MTGVTENSGSWGHPGIALLSLVRSKLTVIDGVQSVINVTVLEVQGETINVIELVVMVLGDVAGSELIE